MILTVTEFTAVQRRSALAFLKQKYQKAYNTSPDLTEHDNLVYFINQENVRISGLLCLEIYNQKAFSFEKFFSCEGEEFMIINDNKESGVYLSRWVAEGQVGVDLLREVLKWCLENGKTHVFACSKPRILRYLTNTLKLPIIKLPSKIIFAHMPDEHANFYFTKPFPILYVGNCREWYDILVL